MYLVVAASLSVLIALLHLACLFIGTPMYRWLGAGDHVVRMAEKGDAQAAIAAAIVATGLMVCALYAFSAAGVSWMWAQQLPLRRTLLVLLSLLLFARALAFPYLRSYFPGNSELFWWSSSILCLLLALLYAIGLRQVWGGLA